MIEKPPAPPRAKEGRLGEELPVFCERCGYSLHGLAQTRCEHCTVLQFHCPECGHHQPINTLRPAFQALLGRLRACWLALLVAAKIAFFGLMCFAWAGMGAGWSYEYHWERAPKSNASGVVQQQSNGPVREPTSAPKEAVFAFLMFGLAIGMVGRMLLLRWRRGYLVGLALAILLLAACCVGAQIESYSQYSYGSGVADTLASPFAGGFFYLLLVGGLAIVGGAGIVWGIWTLLVRAFLPAKTAKALLDWQISLSNRVSELARATDGFPLPEAISDERKRQDLI